MAKIFISSDQHLDINRLDVDQILAMQANYLQEQKAAAYIIAGDSFNYFEKTLSFAERLQVLVGSGIKIKFLAGNHEMGHGVTFDELESEVSSLYLHNKRFQIGDTVVLGNNGWYDYSLARGSQKQQVQQFKQGFYYDQLIEQPLSDPERTDLSLMQLKKALDATTSQQRVIVVQHFVPNALGLQYPVASPRWQMVNGVMGSKRYAELYAQYPQIEAVVSGHVHRNQSAQQIQQIKYQNVSVGYYRGKRMEWVDPEFSTSWQKKLFKSVDNLQGDL